MDGLKAKGILTAIKLIWVSKCDYFSKILIIFLYLIGCFKLRFFTIKNGNRWIQLKSRKWNPFILFSDCFIQLEIPFNVIIDMQKEYKVFVREIV